MLLLASTTGCTNTPSADEIPVSVSVAPSAADSLNQTYLVHLSDITGKTVDEAKAILGFPDRLAGMLAYTKRVELVGEQDPVATVNTDWIVTGWCLRTQLKPAPDALTLSAVPNSVYQPGYIKGQDGYNNFPQQWADERACDTNATLQIPVLKS